MRSRLLIAILLICTGLPAPADTGHVEYTTLLNSDSVNNMHSFGAYSPVTRSGNMQVYAGLELAWFKLDSNDDFTFTPRISIGVTTGRMFAPFVEIGTNLLDLLTLMDNEARDCNQQACDPDFFIKAGFSIRLNHELSLAVFYQGIHFGGFTDILTGDHDIFAASIGLHF
jgi:hypothetical protein